MSTPLRELQLVELEILKDVVKICEENNLRYFLMGGTFLGAVRHKGFIPWDDDIDIAMPREDYENFFEIVDQKLHGDYIYKNFKKGNEKTIYFSRVENINFEIEDNSAIKKRIRNAWIDIFPLDGMPNNRLVRFFHKIRLLYLRVTLQYSQFSVIVNQNLPNRPLHENILIKIGKMINFERILDTEKCMNKLDIALKKYNYHNSKYVVNFMGAYKFKEMFLREIYDDTEKYEFETEQLIAPKNFNFVLSQMYGDYMTPPREDAKNKHNTKTI
ncbi:LicD family protein [Bacillus sp. AGMB 02131]|uniref:LicD family protein n=1 Tax=Peribacillus faecalis TaxID=2772559 RepID=A0A927CTK9_9BACI|nr:LicD family protein [Peribacillus faecalis]MBD3107613.1 LicD family protein [Peribacillus faecalis]